MANINGVTISTDRLVGTAGTLRTLNSKMTAKLEAITAQINNLSTSWESEASQEIVTEFKKLMPKFEEYRKSVESYARFLDQAAQAYISTDNASM